MTSSVKKKALGRGLSALIPNHGPDALASPNGSGSPKRDYFMCVLSKIHPATVQPRKHFDEAALDDLAASIKESGLIQPLVVRPLEGGETYELIAGERRWRASQRAGLKKVPVVVKDVDDAVAFALALIENIQRQDLNPVEEALAYRRLCEDFEISQTELAEQLGKSRASISNSMRLLNLPQDVLEHVADGGLNPGHARPLLGLGEAQASALGARIVADQLSVRQVEQEVREMKRLAEAGQQGGVAAEAEVKPQAPWREDEATARITSDLKHVLGTKIQLRDRHGKGRLEIHYEDYDTLTRILGLLEVEAKL